MTSMNDLTVEELKQLVELLYDEKMRAKRAARRIGGPYRSGGESCSCAAWWKKEQEWTY